MGRAVTLILMLIAILALQAVLVKRRGLGLVLPAIFFAFSIIAVLGVEAPASMTNGEVIRMSLAVFTLYNVPTLALLILYALRRNKQ